MNCPRDGDELSVEKHRGLEVDRCGACQGIWLDYHELAELEHETMPDERLRGSLVYSARPSGIDCPVCHEQLQVFQYRARNLEIDMCDKGHGFWLDHGEDKQVTQFLKERVKNLERVAAAEAGWHRLRRGGGSKSLLDRIKSVFTGR